MEIDFGKYKDGLVPTIIQDAKTKIVLMLGYSNQQSLMKTKEEGKVTFFSRSKNRLWTKGETSGNFLECVSMHIDCDQDAILIYVNPKGPTCHKGTDSCFGVKNEGPFLKELESIIHQRIDSDDSNSYTNELMKKGIKKVAQKVGEEAVELVLEAQDDKDDLFLEEASDLMYHYLVLLKAKGMKLADVEGVLKSRNTPKSID